MLRRIIGLAVCVCVCVAGTARAQSFGRNKVHYDALDFRVLETPHFNVHYYPAEHDAAVQAGRLAERWYARLSAALHDEFTERQPIVLYASHAQFAQTNVVAGLLGEGVGGVTDQERGRVVLPFAPGLGETDHVLGHEIVHAFQRDILKKNNRAMNSLPLWFIEGMAEYLSIGGIDTNTSMWLRDAVAQDDLPRIADLDNPNYFPYRYGQSLWAYLAHTFGEDVVSKAMVSRAKGGASGRLAAVTGKSVYSLTEGWHAFIRERSHVEPQADDDKADEKRDVKDPAVKKPPKPIVSLANGGRLNVGPALSPDGRSLVFLSERDQYSIDVYVANTTTGAISRKLVATAGDPHFESLQFIESAGGWDPSGKRFALAALAGGLPVLSDLQRRERLARARVSHSWDRSGVRPDVVTRRQTHRVLGNGRRPERSLRARSREGQRTGAHARRVCRPAARVVAGRTNARVRHRSLFVVARDAQIRPVQARADRHPDRRDHAAAQRLECQEHRPALVARRRQPVLHRRCGQHQQRVPVERRER